MASWSATRTGHCSTYLPRQDINQSTMNTKLRSLARPNWLASAWPRQGRRGPLSNIVEGLIIGVGAGLTTAITLGIGRLLIWCWHRREQKTYIRNLIAGPVKTILTADDLLPPEPGGNPVPADCVRYVIFRKLQSDLEVAISSRATALKYHEVSSLREVMARTDLLLTNLTLHARKIIPLKIAEGFYDDVRGLCWLGLPRDLRAESLTQPS